MQEKVITVKGIGKVSKKPDIIVLRMELNTVDHDYEKALEKAAENTGILSVAIMQNNFEKADIKTTSFDVKTKYESYRDKNNDYKSNFVGYECVQELKLEFDFNTTRLGKVLSSVAKSSVIPKLHIEFSIKDKASVSEELLINATQNAKIKAEILTKAAGVKLGELINIDYNWSELHLFSPTRFEMDDSIKCSATEFEIEPDDIEVNDTVSFVWQLQ